MPQSKVFSKGAIASWLHNPTERLAPQLLKSFISATAQDCPSPRIPLATRALTRAAAAGAQPVGPAPRSYTHLCPRPAPVNVAMLISNKYAAQRVA